MAAKNRSSNEVDLDQLREELAEAKADLRELKAAAVIASRHLKDPEGMERCKALGENLQRRLQEFSIYLEYQEEIESLKDGRGLNKATRATLIERREMINKLLGEE